MTVAVDEWDEREWNRRAMHREKIRSWEARLRNEEQNDESDFFFFLFHHWTLLVLSRVISLYIRSSELCFCESREVHVVRTLLSPHQMLSCHRKVSYYRA